MSEPRVVEEQVEETRARDLDPLDARELTRSGGELLGDLAGGLLPTPCQAESDVRRVVPVRSVARTLELHGCARDLGERGGQPAHRIGL